MFVYREYYDRSQGLAWTPSVSDLELADFSGQLGVEADVGILGHCFPRLVGKELRNRQDLEYGITSEGSTINLL